MFALGARDYFFKSPLFVSEVTFTLHVLFLRRVVTFTFWSLFSLFHPYNSLLPLQAHFVTSYMHVVPIYRKGITQQEVRGVSLIGKG